jgi:TonB family protein
MKSVTAKVLCAAVLAALVSVARADTPDSIFAADWEVAKGLEQIALPPAPAEGDDARSVMKVWIGADGSVARTRLESGSKELGKLLEKEMPRWRYRKFNFGGRPVEVQTYVTVVYERRDNRYYVQGDGRVLYGPPGALVVVAKVAKREGDPVGFVEVDPSRGGASGDKVEPVPADVVAGKAKYRPTPAYPESAKRAEVSGQVTVTVVVGKTGRVLYAVPNDGHALLQPPAVSAAREWTFTPTVVAGEPTLVIGTVTFTFHGRR